MKKNSKKAIIVAMSAMTGINLANDVKAMECAMADMKSEGMDVVEYTWDPYDGMLA